MVESEHLLVKTNGSLHLLTENSHFCGKAGYLLDFTRPKSWTFGI
jgi:hypothetical protein